MQMVVLEHAYWLDRKTCSDTLLYNDICIALIKQTAIVDLNFVHSSEPFCTFYRGPFGGPIFVGGGGGGGLQNTETPPPSYGLTIIMAV